VSAYRTHSQAKLTVDHGHETSTLQYIYSVLCMTRYTRIIDYFCEVRIQENKKAQLSLEKTRYSLYSCCCSTDL